MTAEERLLQVIEDRETPLKRPDSGGIRYWLKGFRFRHSSVNRTLSLLIALGLAGVVANLFFFKPDIQHVYSRAAQASTTPAPSAAVASAPPVDSYLEAITRRDLFQPGGDPEAKPVNFFAPPVAEVNEKLKEIQLVGIAWGTYPEAMLRDKKGGRTYFVKEADTFEQILVKEIQKDRVVVEYKGQTHELR